MGLTMNDRDYDNLQFLLNATPETLQDWFDTLIAQGEDDDINYAFELIKQARTEVELQVLEVFDADSEESVAVAAEYLKKFRL